MLSRNSPRAIRGLLRTLRNPCTATPTPAAAAAAPPPPPSPALTSQLPSARISQSSERPFSVLLARQFHSTPLNRKGLRPESSDPAPPNTQKPNNVAGGSTHVLEATPITDELYREYSEEYFNVLLSELEELQETGSDIEAEYSAGVLTINVPGVGTYVLNKQPPNRQIWLSSPISGPKRYDWVVLGDGQHEKEGTREYVGGQWIYLRDGSNLTTLLNEELGLEMDYNIYARQQ
ncbi:hypothetical protein VTO42DRAFT_5006 [Malbranchea cinnamomea]